MTEHVVTPQLDRSIAVRPHDIAVLIPCFNEELTVASVVRKFRDALPQATIYVYDNNSTDRTIELARLAGAVVRREQRQGKGHVVRRMFADIDAAIYLMVDGDDTYDAEAAPRLVQRFIDDQLDFLNGARTTEAIEAYRPGHRLGNYVLSSLVGHIFGKQFKDMLSGYKLFSRRFAKSFPAMSGGFEIETELTVHALELQMPCGEEDTVYRERPTGSASKLKTYRDGMRILALIGDLIRNERPLQFFGMTGLVLILVAIGIDVPLAQTYFGTGLVPRLPTAVFSVGLLTIGTLSCLAGLILDMVTTSRQEMKRLIYLSVERRPRDDR